MNPARLSFFGKGLFCFWKFFWRKFFVESEEGLNADINVTPKCSNKETGKGKCVAPKENIAILYL
jgi:hypothetical protein